MEEIWKDIKDYEGLYQVSNLGRVKSVERIKTIPPNKTYTQKSFIMKPYYHYNGYPIITLSKNGIRFKDVVHRIVAKHFIENPENYKYVCHKDDNPLNNKADNLYWGTQQDNMNDKVSKNRQQKGENVKFSKLNNEKIKEIRNMYEKGKITHKEIGRIYDISTSCITEIINLKSWKHVN